MNGENYGPVGANVPDFEQITRYQVNVPRTYAVTRQPRYDKQTYAAAGQTSLQFFQSQVGQNSKTYQDTNMSITGMLAQPIYMLVMWVELRFYPGNLPSSLDATGDYTAIPNFINDVYTFAKAGWLEFFVGSQTQFREAPLDRIPASTGLAATAAYAMDMQTGANGVGTEYASIVGRLRTVDPWILLIPNQNFSVTLNWPAAVALPSTVDATVYCHLEGLEYRLAQ